MKKLIFTALGMVLSITSTQSLNAVKLCAPFQDTSTHERVVSNNPAVELGLLRVIAASITQVGVPAEDVLGGMISI